MARGAMLGEMRGSSDDAPVIGDGHQDERKEATGQRLGLVAEALVDAAAALGAQEDTAAVETMVELGLARPGQTGFLERLQTAQVLLRVPALSGDALDLGSLGVDTVDTVIDSGVFHVFDDEDRARYVASLAAVLRPGGRCYLMCFSDRQPGDWGPRRVRADELREAFRDEWAVESISADAFEINPIGGTTQAQAWLATIRRS